MNRRLTEKEVKTIHSYVVFDAAYPRPFRIGEVVKFEDEIGVIAIPIKIYDDSGKFKGYSAFMKPLAKEIEYGKYIRI